jgi:hypothetical protein
VQAVCGIFVAERMRIRLSKVMDFKVLAQAFTLFF